MKDIEKQFLTLPYENREAIISYGASLYLASLKKRCFLAEQKIIKFENRYKITLEKIEAEGIPDDSGHELHEDYVEWCHWASILKKCRNEIASIHRL